MHVHQFVDDEARRHSSRALGHSNMGTVMKLRVHKTHPGLWFVLSVCAFVAIGFLIKIDVKGEDERILWLLPATVADAVRNGFGAFIFVWLGPWIIVSTLIGWILQSIVILVIDRKYEKSKPLA